MTSDPPDDSAGPSFRVLVVDDNRDAADSTALLLRVTGFEARAFYDAETALAAAPAFRPGVCLLDLNMPDMDGDEVVVLLRPLLDRRTLLVALTAMGDDFAGDRIRAAGFHLHLVKPVDPRSLVAVVDAQWRLWGGLRPTPTPAGRR